jgi:DNA-binding beta-propeller fold protein YncE
MSSKSIAVIAVAGAGLALVFAAAAGAATNLAQKPGPGGCVTQNGIAGECADGSGLVGPSALAISPDAENVYAADQAWGGVATLSRNAGDGSLAPLPGPTGCLSTVDVDCSHPRLMEGARDLVISPDGKNVYVAAPGSNAVAVLSRDQGDGHLTQPSGTGGCVSGSGASGCGEGRAVDEPTTLVVSPDGKEVYVGSEGLNGGIAIFQRDQETGDLSQEPGGAGCVNESGTAGCTDGLAEMGGLETLSISPDGRTLYAMSPARDAVTLYSRDPETGALTPLPAPAGCLVNSPADGCSVVIGLGEPRGLAFSSVGEESAYLASERRDAILVFDRNPATGALTQKPGTAGCVSNTGRSDPMQAGTEGACVNGVAMDAINSIAVLPDGSALYATTRESDGVVVFGRAADGTIAQRPGTDGCITETGFEVVDLPWTEGTCQDGRGLLAADGIVASADGAHIYTSARYGGIDAFDVVAPPGPEQRPTAGTAAGPTISQACKEARARAAKIADRLKALAKENKRKARKATFVTSEAARDKLNEAADRGRRQAKSIRLSLRQANLTVRQLCL